MAGQRRFRGFVVFGEGTVGGAGAEELGVTVLHHDEGQLAALIGHGRPGAVGHVAHPLGAVPFNNGLLGIERLAVHIHRSAVIQNATVHRPAPRPVGEQTNVGLHGRLAGITAFGLVAFFFCPAACVDPVERRGRTVVLKRRKSRHELAAFVLLVAHLGISPEETVDAARPVRSVVLVRPVHLEDGLGQDAAFGLVEIAYLVEQGHNDVRKVACFAAGLYALIEPLQPAAAVADGAFLFNTVSRG